jgi:hypothetical protein
MKTLALTSCLIAAAAFAQPAEAPPAPGFKPRVVTKAGDKKGIDELYKASDEALKKGDIEALAARIDFPLMMMTDDSAGVPSTSSWEKQLWIDTMKASIANLPKDVKMAKKTRATFISDSLAMVEEANERTVGKKKETWTSAALVGRKDGRWMFKAMIEGGWGDQLPSPVKAEAPKAEPVRTPVKAIEAAKPAPK